jgi:hypothetical protein
VIRLSRRDEQFEASVVTMVAIYSAIGLRDPALNARLGAALKRGMFPRITRLRRDAHDESSSCWLHAPAFCIG